MRSEYSRWPNYSEQEGDIVKDVLLSNRVNYWTGDKGKLFEKQFAEYVDCGFGVAVANGSLALEAALRVLDVGPGDEVIVPPRTYVATASAVAMLGAIPVFADIDIATQNIDPLSIQAHITPRTKAIICVHLGGLSCDMDAILTLTKQHNIYLIEDCAQAHGAKYRDKSVGSFGDIAAWSFCQDKIMTTGGEGGMLTTNSEPLFKKLWSLKDHGKSYDKVKNLDARPGFKWLHDSIGSNYRMTEMQAALGLYQLQQLDAWVARRRQNARQFKQLIDQYSFLDYHRPEEKYYHAYYRFYAVWQHASVSRDEFLLQAKARHLPLDQGSCSEVYLEQAFAKVSSCPEKPLPNAHMLTQRSVVFLVHPSLQDDELVDICLELEQLLDELA